MNYRYIAYALILAAIGLFMVPFGNNWMVLFLVPIAIAGWWFGKKRVAKKSCDND